MKAVKFFQNKNSILELDRLEDARLISEFISLCLWQTKTIYVYGRPQTSVSHDLKSNEHNERDLQWIRFERMFLYFLVLSEFDLSKLKEELSKVDDPTGYRNFISLLADNQLEDYLYLDQPSIHWPPYIQGLFERLLSGSLFYVEYIVEPLPKVPLIALNKINEPKEWKPSLGGSDQKLVDDFEAIVSGAFSQVFQDFEWFRIHHGGCYSSGDRFDVEESVIAHQKKLTSDLKPELANYLNHPECKDCILDAIRFITDSDEPTLTLGQSAQQSIQHGKSVKTTYRKLIKSAFTLEDVATLSRYDSKEGRYASFMEIVNRLIKITCWFHNNSSSIRPKP